MASHYGGRAPATVAEISEELEKEEEWLRRLEGNLHRSKELRDGMVGILDGFEAHLDRLSSTVDPLYQNTRRLQTRQSNIAKVLKTVGKRMEVYQVADESNTSLRDSDPDHDLQAYLRNMRKLQDAMTYFAQDSHNAEHLDKVRSSFDAGVEALLRCFRDTTRRVSSQPLGASILLAAVGPDHHLLPNSLTPDHLLASSDVDKLSTLADWLRRHSNSRNTDFLSFYVEERCRLIIRSLKGLLTSRKTTSLGQSPKNERKMSTVPYKRSMTVGVEALADESAERDAETFLLLLVSFRGLLQAETLLLKRIVKSEALEERLYSHLVAKPLEMVLAEAQAPLSTTRRLINKGEFGSVLKLCPVSDYLHRHDDSLSTLARNGPDGRLAERYEAVVADMDKLIVAGCDALVHFVKTEQEKMVPKDGTVHERVSNTLVLMGLLAEERDALSPLLVRYDSTGACDSTAAALPKLFARVLSALGLNLRTKANSYLLPAHRDLFLLNNLNHILKSLSSSGVLAVVREQNPQVGSYYAEQVGKHSEAYVGTWAVLAEAVRGLPQGQTLQDKERQEVKAAFAAFNRELEGLVKAGEGMSVPDAALAADLRARIADAVLRPYAAAYATHKSSNFTKHPDKYLKYLPETLSQEVQRLFDGQPN